MYTIRNYINADYPFVKRILEESDLFDTVWDSKENLIALASNYQNGILVATESGEVVGCVFIIPFGSKVAWIFRLAVKKEHRKHGIATQLIIYAEELLKKQGVVEVGLYVSGTNKQLQEFYKKRRFDSSGKEWVYMWKKI